MQNSNPKREEDGRADEEDGEEKNVFYNYYDSNRPEYNYYNDSRCGEEYSYYDSEFKNNLDYDCYDTVVKNNETASKAKERSHFEMLPKSNLEKSFRQNDLNFRKSRISDKV